MSSGSGTRASCSIRTALEFRTRPAAHPLRVPCAALAVRPRCHAGDPVDLRTSGAPRIAVPPPVRRRGRGGATPAARPPAGAPTHLFVTEGGLTGTRIGLTGAPVLIGRANDSTLVLEDDY